MGRIGLWHEFGKQLSSMYTCVVKNHKRLLLDTQRESVKEISDLVGSNALIRGKAVMEVVSVNHAEDIESF